MISVESIYLSKLEQFHNVMKNNAAKCEGAALAFEDILNAVDQRMNLSQTGQGSKTAPNINTNNLLETVPRINTGSLSKTNDEIEDAIKSAAMKIGFDEDLIRAVIQVESSFRTEAVSGAGAQGLMQLMPATAKELGVDDPFNAYDNIMGGTKYLAQQIERFGDVRLALAAYNTGPRRIASLNISDANDAQEYAKISSRVQGYVEKVLSYYKEYSQG